MEGGEDSTTPINTPPPWYDSSYTYAFNSGSDNSFTRGVRIQFTAYLLIIKITGNYQNILNHRYLNRHSPTKNTLTKVSSKVGDDGSKVLSTLIRFRTSNLDHPVSEPSSLNEHERVDQIRPWNIPTI